jgi:hypothetical protein
MERLDLRAAKQLREQSYYKKNRIFQRSRFKVMAQMNRIHRTKSLTCHSFHTKGKPISLCAFLLILSHGKILSEKKQIVLLFFKQTRMF